MNPRALFIIAGDPRVSPRPAEAIRIAAGVGTWKKADITLYLREEGVLALSEYVDDFVDDDAYTRYLPIIGEFGHPVYVQRGTPLLRQLGEPRLPIQDMDETELAILASQNEYVLHF